MIEVKDLCKNYGDRLAIDHLNFTVKKGEVIGFLGPNGAGKTTTMKIITGFMAPTSGSVRISGHDVFENPIEVKRRIGYLPETPPVYGDMFVRDYLNFVAKLRRTDPAKISGNVDRALQKTNLGDVQNRLIKNLSKGFRQRVGLAQALVSDPEILILDEPTVGLDPRQVAEVRSLILSLRGHHTIILSTHILPEVQAMCERVIIINGGKIIAEDTLDGLSKRMAGGWQVVLRVRRSAQDLVGSLRSVKGVRGATAQGASQIVVETDPSDDALEALARFVVEKGSELIEMRTASLDLEDVFIRLTSGNGKEVSP